MKYSLLLSILFFGFGEAFAAKCVVKTFHPPGKDRETVAEDLPIALDKAIGSVDQAYTFRFSDGSGIAKKDPSIKAIEKDGVTELTFDVAIPKTTSKVKRKAMIKKDARGRIVEIVSEKVFPINTNKPDRTKAVLSYDAKGVCHVDQTSILVSDESNKDKETINYHRGLCEKLLPIVKKMDADCQKSTMELMKTVDDFAKAESKKGVSVSITEGRDWGKQSETNPILAAGFFCTDDFPRYENKSSDATHR